MAETGWDKVRKAQRKAEESRKATFPKFFLLDGAEAVIQFVSDSPYVHYQHSVQVDGRWRTFVCLSDIDEGDEGENCPLCKRGNSPRFVGAFYVVDYRGSWSSTSKSFDGVPVVKLYTPGILVLGQLEKINSKKPRGLSGYKFEITRTGEGFNTSYNFDTLEEADVPEELTKDLPPLDTILKPMTSEELKKKCGFLDDDGAITWD